MKIETNKATDTLNMMPHITKATHSPHQNRYKPLSLPPSHQARRHVPFFILQGERQASRFGFHGRTSICFYDGEFFVRGASSHTNSHSIGRKRRRIVFTGPYHAQHRPPQGMDGKSQRAAGFQWTELLCERLLVQQSANGFYLELYERSRCRAGQFYDRR